ncbi:hypothetical protein ACF0H5_022043 [Mactra antiquata]
MTESTSTLQVTTMTTKTYTGLWQTCWRKTFSVQNDYGCESILDTPKDTDGLKAVQAVTTIGCVIILVTIVLSIIDLFCFDKSSVMMKIVGGLSIFAGLVLIVGPIVYGVVVREGYKFEILDLDIGFALIILTSALAILAGILACLV